MPYTRWSPNCIPLKAHQFEMDTHPEIVPLDVAKKHGFYLTHVSRAIKGFERKELVLRETYTRWGPNTAHNIREGYDFRHWGYEHGRGANLTIPGLSAAAKVATSEGRQALVDEVKALTWAHKAVEMHSQMVERALLSGHSAAQRIQLGAKGLVRREWEFF